MGGNNGAIVDGYGYLSLQGALDVARNSEGGVDPNITAFLERAIHDVWGRLSAAPETYILSKDEFALFNFYRQRFSTSPLAQRAVQRFWDSYQGKEFAVNETALFAQLPSGTDMELSPSTRPLGLDDAICDGELKFRKPTGTKRWFRSLLMGGFEDRSRVYGREMSRTRDEKSDSPGKEINSLSMIRLLKASRLLICSMLVLITFRYSLTFCNATGLTHLNAFSSRSLVRNAVALSVPLLEVFMVSNPVPTPVDTPCEQIIMVHVFAYSYGKPFIGPYDPPSCQFNRVILNFTVTSAGRQFDRLGLMYLNDTEIFRTSTAEPTATGIEWTYMKDVSNYLSLFKQSQKIIFDLGNLIDDTYTAPFNTTLTAIFLHEEGLPQPADLILPVSSRQSASDGPSAFNIPHDTAINTLTLPQNLKRAVFTISASGQSTEEFWWSNVPSSNAQTFADTTTLYGYSPFREVQLFVDGTLAGVQWPFPVIFTGGIVPGFWRPIVGIDAFDLLEDEIDLTPLLPLLCDGGEHSFEIRVVGINDDGQGNGTLSKSVGDYWVVTGKLFLWFDEPGFITTGSQPTFSSPSPTLHISSVVRSSTNGTNETLTYSVEVQRTFSVESTISTSEGSIPVSWRQTLFYSNGGELHDKGYVQTVEQQTNGNDVSSRGYARTFNYPLWVYSSYWEDAASGNFSIDAALDRGKKVQIRGDSVFPNGLQPYLTTNPAGHTFAGSSSDNRQNGTAFYLAVPSRGRSYSWGATEQDFSFSGVKASESLNSQVGAFSKGDEELYHRHALAVNGTVVEDEESPIMQPQSPRLAELRNVEGFGRLDVMSLLGRGPAHPSRQV
ncbi:hypothetical protein M501DRAFT_1014822 [Patellaria atrata CBS 101060]|uniref:Peptide N-acetyl-beta-D-glucosaminyl asparaginase amidase A N-terminal domain-containing protein n=1 Tax=Patellaria atrata CBS 101060 TaxID=1346257 RepID=A0A9P4SDM9_9PEZI|nr:hypothetical protein M501DRAFT_1014822 [Patellaria atrata CBS 101060]